jgi:histidine ammonia-lyase
MNADVDPIVFNGKPLTFESLARIGARLAPMAADPAALERVRKSRKVVEDRIAQGLPVYGSTTGVGAM